MACFVADIDISVVSPGRSSLRKVEAVLSIPIARRTFEKPGTKKTSEGEKMAAGKDDLL